MRCFKTWQTLCGGSYYGKYESTAVFIYLGVFVPSSETKKQASLVRNSKNLTEYRFRWGRGFLLFDVFWV